MIPLAVARAMNVSMEAHHGQVRKYTGEPYWLHCLAVYDQVTEWGGTDAMRCAALLHDTLEDTDYSKLSLLKTFGTEVFGLVIELTDEFTRENYPKLGRAERKRLEAMRIAQTSIEARVVKLADINDNTKTIEPLDPGFAKVYIPEKNRLLALMGDPLAEFRAKQSP